MEEPQTDGAELRSLIRGVIEEFVQAEQVKAEPAYKAELLDERKRREDLAGCGKSAEFGKEKLVS